MEESTRWLRKNISILLGLWPDSKPSTTALPDCLQAALPNTAGYAGLEADWVQVFGDERFSTGLLDRLTHHADIIELVGESYRFRQRMHQEVDA